MSKERKQKREVSSSKINKLLEPIKSPKVLALLGAAGLTIGGVVGVNDYVDRTAAEADAKVEAYTSEYFLADEIVNYGTAINRDALSEVVLDGEETPAVVVTITEMPATNPPVQFEDVKTRPSVSVVAPDGSKVDLSRFERVAPEAAGQSPWSLVTDDRFDIVVPLSAADDGLYEVHIRPEVANEDLSYTNTGTGDITYALVENGVVAGEEDTNAALRERSSDIIFYYPPEDVETTH